MMSTYGHHGIQRSLKHFNPIILTVMNKGFQFVDLRVPSIAVGNIWWSYWRISHRDCGGVQSRILKERETHIQIEKMFPGRM